MKQPRSAIAFTVAAALLADLLACARSNASSPTAAIAVATPARAGLVEGRAENSDAFIWRLFTEFTAPVSSDDPSRVVFETWASDKDTFSNVPHWPAPDEPLDLQMSVLGAKGLGVTSGDVLALRSIDEECKAPRGAAVGAFPTSGIPLPCSAEQVGRNRAQFDYIVNNQLNTQAGLAAAFAKSFKVEMPVESVAIKGDWVPLPNLLQWVPKLGDIASARRVYFTATVKGTEYALVAMHVSSRQNPNWVWGTFEHQMNPGRCDYIGCFDSYGAQKPIVAPNRDAFNTQYGPCPKTAQLKALMAKANALPLWENYCLKSTQVDFAASDGTPYALGNSVIEGIVGNGTVAASSCISCHYYASFGANGTPSLAARAILPFNPTGKPIPGVLSGSQQYAFMWGVLAAP